MSIRIHATYRTAGFYAIYPDNVPNHFAVIMQSLRIDKGYAETGCSLALPEYRRFFHPDHKQH